MIFQVQTGVILTVVFKIALVAGVVSLIFIISRLLQVFIERFAKKSKKVTLGTINGLKLAMRVSALVAVFYSTLIILEFPIEDIFGFSTIIGAVVSFGSVQWISNFIAGVYLLLLRPFSINDFIELGDDTRGTVEELSLNYTKIKTINGIYHYIPNRVIVRSNLKLYYGKKKRIVGGEELEKQAKDQKFQRFRHLARYLIEERIVRYTFLWGAPLGDVQLTKRKLLEVCEIYAGVFGYIPEFYLESLGYRMFFRFVISTLNTNLLVKNLIEFKNDLTEAFH